MLKAGEVMVLLKFLHKAFSMWAGASADILTVVAHLPPLYTLWVGAGIHGITAMTAFPSSHVLLHELICVLIC